MARVGVRLGAILAIVIAVTGASGQSQGPLDSDELVAKWLDAVRFHAAGQTDDSVRWLGSLSPDAWKALDDGLKRYFGALARDRSTSRAVIERAVVFHTDAAMFGPAAPADGLAAGWPTPATPGLVKTMDGAQQGAIDANGHWMLARLLLDLRLVSPRNDAFGPVWYHATAAYLLQHRLFGEAGTHLQRAASLFPNDARLLFDRGCLSETLGLPSSRAVIDDLIARRTPSGELFIPGQPPTASARWGLPTEAQANAEAERLFRRALEIDATLIEARVRVARLLEVRGKYDDASAELESVFRGAPIADPVIAYHAHLFAARASRMLGHSDAAAAHVRDALALFPDAQSALVAASQIALRDADAAAALAPVRRLGSLPADAARRDDPWWSYDTGPGRHAESLLNDMWARSRALGR